jgi:hypothetical protein
VIIRFSPETAQSKSSSSVDSVYKITQELPWLMEKWCSLEKSVADGYIKNIDYTTCEPASYGIPQ